jgi:hypothetical protein
MNESKLGTVTTPRILVLRSLRQEDREFWGYIVRLSSKKKKEEEQEETHDDMVNHKILLCVKDIRSKK